MAGNDMKIQPKVCLEQVIGLTILKTLSLITGNM